MIEKVVEAVVQYLPAYVANGTPVVLGGGPPLDGGKRWSDGWPILGANKTIRGCITGVLAGALIGLLQGNLMSGFAQGVGAIFGDLVSSFLKRRLNKPPGSGMPLLDQLDFIVFGVILSFPFQDVRIDSVVIILLITVPIHYATNIVAWWLKLKKNPW